MRYWKSILTNVNMLAGMLLMALLLCGSNRAQAIGYTDAWYDQNEPGWGALLVQSHTFQFLAFYVYGQNGGPRWYTAQITDDGTGKYTGGLYASNGTYWGSPWDQSKQTTTQVGTVSFQPTDLYHATLTFTVTGEGTFTKPLVRLTLTPFNMNGNYSGSISGSVSGCPNPANNDPAIRARYALGVTQIADTSATLTFTFVDNVYSGNVCTLSGPLTHLGRLYRIPTAQYTCTGPLTNYSATATVEALSPTGEGIEGEFTANVAGCAQSIHFAAVKNSLQ